MKATTILRSLVLGVIVGVLGFATSVGYAAGDLDVTGNLTVEGGRDIFLKAKANDLDAGDIIFQAGDGYQLARIYTWENTLNFSTDPNSIARVIFDEGGNILLRAKAKDRDAGDLIFQTGGGAQLARIYSWENTLNFSTDPNSVAMAVLDSTGNFLLRAKNRDAGDVIFQTGDGTQLARIWSWENSLNFCTNPDNKVNVAIDSAGNMGIGTAVPAQKLHVAGYVLAKGYYTGDLFFQKDGRTLWRMFEDEAGLYVESQTTGKKYNVVLQEVGSKGAANADASMAALQAENTALKQKMAELEAKLDAFAQKLP